MTIKRSFLLIAITLISSFCFSQKVIQLTKQDGVYTIPCSINGVKRSLIFDTGASTVTISMKLADLLYSSGKLRNADFKGLGRSQTASGHIVNNMAVVLRDVEIGGLHLKNVDAVIIEGQNVPLLLGLSAIQKLGKVTLSGNQLIIDTSILTNPQLEGLRTQIESHIDKMEYSSAIYLLKKIESQDAIEEIDLFNLARCYCFSKDYNKSLMYCQQWIGTYKETMPLHEPDVCYFMGISYNGLKSYYDADSWFAKAINLIGKAPINQTNINDAISLTYYYNQKGLNCLEGKGYDVCAESFDIAAQYRLHILDLTPDDIFRGIVKDEKIGNWLYSISQLNAVYLQDSMKANHYAVMAALCGNKDAKKYCDYFKLDYRPR